jgi:hypothetical protein
MFRFFSGSVGIKNVQPRLTSILLLVHLDIKPVLVTARCKARSAADRLLRWIRIPPVVWMSFVSVVCCRHVKRSLRRANRSFRRVLPSVVRRRV